MLYRPDVQVQLPEDLLVQLLIAQLPWHGVDGVGYVLLLDDAFALDVAEEGELPEVLFRNRHFRAADEDVWYYANVAELAHGMLRGLRLEFACGLQVGNKRQVNEARVLGSLLEAELPRRLEEGERFNVSRDASDLAEHDVRTVLPPSAAALAGLSYRGFYFVRDVRHHLHGSPEVAACAFARDYGGVYAAGGVVGRLCARDARKALVVPEVEVRLRAVVRHEDLSVLVRAHRPRIDVEVWIQLLHEDAVATAL